MKKIYVLLVLVMTIFLLTGCNGKEKVNDEIEVNAEPFCVTITGDEDIVYLTEGPLYNGSLPIQIEYSTDGKEWKEYKLNEEIRLFYHGSVFFRGDNPNGLGGIVKLSSAGQISVSGNIMSLIDPTCKRNDVPSFGFAYFFKRSYVYDVSGLSLPATTLGDSCYLGLFLECKYLTNIPNLPIAQLQSKCYSEMFKNTAIKVSENQSDEYTVPFVIDAVDDGVDYTSDMFLETPGEYTGAIELGKTYYIAE